MADSGVNTSQNHDGLAKRYTSLTAKEIEDLLTIGITDLATIDKKARRSKEESISKWTVHNQNERQVINLVLLGKTGAGKSATGNLILDTKQFQESPASKSCTQHIEKGECVIGNVEVNIIDTPGFDDTDRKPRDIAAEISKVVEEFSDGIDGFLYVFNMGNPRFTKDQEATFIAMEKGLFGKRVIDNCFVILSHLESKPSITSLSKLLEDEKNSSFGKLLNDKLKKRVIGVNNTDKTIHGRMVQRQNIMELILARKGERFTSKEFEQSKLEQSNLVQRLPRNMQGMAKALRIEVSDALRQKSHEEMKALKKDKRTRILEELVQKMMAYEEVQPEWTGDVQKAVMITLDHQLNKLVGDASLKRIGLIVILLTVSSGVTIAGILAPEFMPLFLPEAVAIITTLLLFLKELN